MHIKESIASLGHYADPYYNKRVYAWPPLIILLFRAISTIPGITPLLLIFVDISIAIIINSASIHNRKNSRKETIQPTDSKRKGSRKLSHQNPLFIQPNIINLLLYLFNPFTLISCGLCNPKILIYAAIAAILYSL